MKFLEKHIQGFFLLNVYYNSFLLIFSIWLIIHFFGPHMIWPWYWHSYQWNSVNFIYLAPIEGIPISIIIIYLFIKQYYFAFPLNAYLTYGSFIIFPNIIQDYLQGRTEPTTLMGELLFSICFLISLVSSILWLKILWLKQPWYSKVVEVS